MPRWTSRSKTHQTSSTLRPSFLNSCFKNFACLTILRGWLPPSPPIIGICSGLILFIFLRAIKYFGSVFLPSHTIKTIGLGILEGSFLAKDLLTWNRVLLFILAAITPALQDGDRTKAAGQVDFLQILFLAGISFLEIPNGI